MYTYDLRGIFRVAGNTQWPLTAANASEFEVRIREHLLPLPKEPAALANVLEVSIVDFLLDKIAETDGMLSAVRGGERVYPDLYTGNTYFAYPTLHWPGTLRAFADYAQHLDLIGIYTLNRDSASRVEDLELIIQEPWRIGSRQRSSTTREYIGAVTGLEDLRQGRGEFKTEAEFYKFWRAYNFNIGRSVRTQLNKLLAQQAGQSAKE